MLLFYVKKSGLWTLLVLQLLCVLLYPTNGRPSLEDVEVTANGDQDEAYIDETQDEDWDENDDEDTKEYFKISSTEEDLTNDPCFTKEPTSLDRKCLGTLKCCVSSSCKGIRKVLVITPKDCEELFQETSKDVGKDRTNPA